MARAMVVIRPLMAQAGRRVRLLGAWQIRGEQCWPAGRAEDLEGPVDRGGAFGQTGQAGAAGGVGAA